MGICGVCGTKQRKTGKTILQIGKKDIEMQCYNIELLTSMKGISICEDCMETYCKIEALERSCDFSRAGKDYFSDGRNLYKEDDE